MTRLRSRVVPAAGSTSLRRLIIGCSAAAVLLVGGLAVSTAVQATTPPTEEPGGGSSLRRRVDLHGRWISRGVHRARRHRCRRDLARHQCRRNHQHRVMGGNRTGLVQPDVPLVVPHRGRIGRDFHDPRRRRGERGRAELDRRVHRRTHRRRRSPRRVRPRLRDRNAYQRRADGHPGRLPWKPSSPTSSRPRRAPLRRAPNRWRPHRAMLRWQPRRASSRLAPNCRYVRGTRIDGCGVTHRCPERSRSTSINRRVTSSAIAGSRSASDRRPG